MQHTMKTKEGGETKNNIRVNLNIITARINDNKIVDTLEETKET